VNIMTSPDTEKFNKMSQQRVDYQEFPNGAVRARMTVTLPGGKTYQFVEDATPEDVKTYEAQIAGVEIGFALDEIGWIGSADQIGFLGGIVKAIGKGIKAVGKAAGGVVKGIAKVGKAIVTSKVFQTAAKGLAIVAPVLGPLAPAALGAAGAIGVAGKLLGAKNAAKVGAKRTAAEMAKSAVADAKKISPNASGSLLRIATDKANSASKLSGLSSIPQQGGAGINPELASKLRRASDFSPETLQKAHASGRLFLLPASDARAA
jgi:hypothetical protein